MPDDKVADSSHANEYVDTYEKGASSERRHSTVADLNRGKNLDAK